MEPRRDQRVEVVEERDVADDEGDRPVGHGGGAERGRDDAVDAVGAAVGRTVDRPVRGREPGVHVADRHGARRPTGRRRPGARRRGARQGSPSNGSSSVVEPASPSPTSAARVGLEPAAVQAVVRRRRRAPRACSARDRAVAAASAWTNVAGTSAASRQPPSPSRTTSSGRTRASSSRSGLDVGIAPVRRTRSGQVRVEPRARAHELVAADDDLRAVVRSGPEAGQRVGEDREAGDAGELRRAPGAAPDRRPVPPR